SGPSMRAPKSMSPSQPSTEFDNEGSRDLTPGQGLNGMAKKWYVVRVQSGREDTVRENLEKRVKSAGLDQIISRVLVPTEKVSEIKAGRRRVSQKKIYPGYIMLEMDYNEDAWFLVRETPGIGDFIGSHREPVPMAGHEVEKIIVEVGKQGGKPKLKIDFKKGDSVKIKGGPFENFDGGVEG